MRPSTLGARLRSWLRAVSRRSRLEQEMDSELRFHLESYEQDLVRSGVAREEAARRARREFGGIAVHKEDMRASLGLRLWDELCADLLYTERLLRKSPGFTAIALISLALGIGANTTIFSFANHVLLERLHVPHPQQLRLLSITQGRDGVVHMMWGNAFRAQGGYTTTSFAFPIYKELRDNNRVLEDLIAFKGIDRLTAGIDGNAEIVRGELVSGNYYEQLGVSTSLGRPIQPEDDAAPGGGPVVVISDGFWTRRFGRAAEVVGKTITLNLSPVTIIGVNPPGFTGAQGAQRSPDVFVPITMQPLLVPREKGSLLDNTELWWVQIMGRLKPGVSAQEAHAQLGVALDQAVRAMVSVGPKDQVPRLNLEDGSKGMHLAAQEFRDPILVLMALVGLVLLLACANIANLLLARSAARRREMSVRFALGAGRGRIIRQVLTECTALSLAGGGLGLFLGHLGRQAIPRLMANSWEAATAPPPLDWRVLGFTVAISALTGVIFGLVPALQASRVEINSGLKDSSATVTQKRKGYAGRALVAFQIALSMLLVVAAGLFVHTVINLGSAYLGFDPGQIVLFDIKPPEKRYPAPQDVALVRRLEERVAAVPGVEVVSASALPMVANNMWNGPFVPDGETLRPGDDGMADTNAVGAQFFATMRIPILAGRGFDDGDTETSAKVAVVNRALARHFFPNAEPIGKTFGKEHIRIVGICGDTKYSDLRQEAPPTYFVPYRQRPGLSYGVSFEVRTRMKPEAMVPSLRAAVQSVDKDLPLIDVRTQKEQIAATMMQERLFSDLTGGFGVLALILACIGIYGIMACSVARRVNEIGIRIALGARAGQVLLMILSETSWLALLGVAAGLAGALGLTRFVKSMLYGVRPADPITFAGAALLMFAVALLAGWLPARRASRVQPMQALRHE